MKQRQRASTQEVEQLVPNQELGLSSPAAGWLHGQGWSSTTPGSRCATMPSNREVDLAKEQPAWVPVATALSTAGLGIGDS
ncbi:hypothetical protein Nepgr_022768 [Nepenthes gracilis]|uniref:Uncharacterized protein n=1 Tax=Nepenthes gracilis TaxID=150966 RepID=A0AAD3XYR0_NEPGR|nr:hypothetical protein Nepgr_022768 [Nepenthes gracilis]